MQTAKALWHKNDDAVSPVIGTILMVAITVVLAAVLWLMVSGMLTTGDDEKITVNLSSPSVQSFTRGSACWDATMNVNKMTPKDEKVSWTEVKIIVKSAAGSVLQASTVLGADTGVYALVATPEFWYVEATGDAKMGAGDGIKITGMPQTWEGATVELTKAGERIASATLPTNFP
jgi:flagellin-like protein